MAMINCDLYVHVWHLKVCRLMCSLNTAEGTSIFTNSQSLSECLRFFQAITVLTAQMEYRIKTTQKSPECLTRDYILTRWQFLNTRHFFSGKATSLSFRAGRLNKQTREKPNTKRGISKFTYYVWKKPSFGKLTNLCNNGILSRQLKGQLLQIESHKHLEG